MLHRALGSLVGGIVLLAAGGKAECEGGSDSDGQQLGTHCDSPNRDVVALVSECYALGVIEIDYRNEGPVRHCAKLYQTQADVTARALLNG
ncbi:hypothetical protein PSUB009319_30690 [Ralstonia sp. SET104]|nr:hypothetical protein PSUB009319_30690 [Ralstonia sp. SET104]